MKLKQTLQLAAEYEEWFDNCMSSIPRSKVTRTVRWIDRRKSAYITLHKFFQNHGQDFLCLLKLVIDTNGKLSAKELARVTKLNKRIQEMK